MKLEVLDTTQYGDHVRYVENPYGARVYIATQGGFNTAYFYRLDDARMYALQYFGNRTDEPAIRAMSILKWEPGNTNHGHIASCSERIDVTCDGSCDGCPCHKE